MRDKDLIFGKAICALTATPVIATDTLMLMSELDTTGMNGDITVTAIPSRDILADEVLNIKLTHCATENGTYTTVYTYNSHNGVIIKAGERVSFPLPRKLLQYVKATAMVTKGLAAYVSCTVEIFIEMN